MSLFGTRKIKEEQQPSSEWISKIEEDMNYTSDIHRLERLQAHRIFIPDEMMEKNKFNSLLEGAEKQCYAFTADKFSFFKKNLGEASFGIPLEDYFQTVRYITIKGELYKIPPSLIPKLDKYRQNGVCFERRRVKLRVPYRTLSFASEPTLYTYLSYETTAWMYVGKSDYWTDQLDAGFSFSPVTYFRPNNPTLDLYYQFTPNEYHTTDFGTSRSMRKVRQLRR